jgi:hypothetical protein
MHFMSVNVKNGATHSETYLFIRTPRVLPDVEERRQQGAGRYSFGQSSYVGVEILVHIGTGGPDDAGNSLHKLLRRNETWNRNGNTGQDFDDKRYLSGFIGEQAAAKSENQLNVGNHSCSKSLAENKENED